jgi:hypothetical protein
MGKIAPPRKSEIPVEKPRKAGKQTRQRQCPAVGIFRHKLPDEHRFKPRHFFICIPIHFSVTCGEVAPFSNFEILN